MNCYECNEGIFNKIVVVCNTANAMELNFLRYEAYGIDAAVWVGCIGDQGAEAVAGKDVVEIYTEAPYTAGGIEKAKVVLDLNKI